MIFVRGEVSPTAVTPKVTVVNLSQAFTYSVLQFLLLEKEIIIPHSLLQGFGKAAKESLKTPVHFTTA